MFIFALHVTQNGLRIMGFDVPPEYSYELLTVVLVIFIRASFSRSPQYFYELISFALRNIKEILQTPCGRFPDFSI